jgi:hypothetical protein
MYIELSSSNLEMELEQVRFLEFALPDEVFENIYKSDIAQKYHRLLHNKGCKANEYGRAERIYRSLLISVLSDINFRTAFIN